MTEVIKFNLRKFKKAAPFESEIITQLMEEKGDVLKVQLLGKKINLFANPDYIKHVLVDKAQNYTRFSIANWHSE